MDGKLLTQEELLPLFEAARWAPSSRNNQPWRFIITNTEKDKEEFMAFLGDFNKQWCKNAGALVIVLSANTFDNDQPSKTHSFDTGAAWMSLALEGARREFVVHGMEGVDYDKIKQVLQVSENFTVEMMIAIGKFGKRSQLLGELKKRELPSLRKKLDEIISWNSFKWR